MKNANKFIILILASLAIVSCSKKSIIETEENINSNSMIKTEDGKFIDQQLVGTWQGSEKDNQIDGMSKTWTMERNADGSFLLIYETVMNGEKNTDEEDGNWWVKDGLFYELHNVSGETDVYSYEVIDKNTIKFRAKSLAVSMENHDYEFIDKRVVN